MGRGKSKTYNETKTPGLVGSLERIVSVYVINRQRSVNSFQ
jgi:hypothetical protein